MSGVHSQCACVCVGGGATPLALGGPGIHTPGGDGLKVYLTLSREETEV